MCNQAGQTHAEQAFSPHACRHANQPERADNKRRTDPAVLVSLLAPPTTPPCTDISLQWLLCTTPPAMRGCAV